MLGNVVQPCAQEEEEHGYCMQKGGRRVLQTEGPLYAEVWKKASKAHWAAVT